MDYVDISKEAVGQGFALGCFVWLVVYGLNRGWLIFKTFVSF